MDVRHCGWRNDDEFAITIHIKPTRGTAAEVERVVAQARIACLEMKASPRVEVRRQGWVVNIKLVYSLANIQEAFGVTAAQKLAPLILDELRRKLPAL